MPASTSPVSSLWMRCGRQPALEGAEQGPRLEQNMMEQGSGLEQEGRDRV